MKYAFIKSNRETFSVSRMCEIMGVSPSTYYDWLKRPVSARSLEDRRLGEKVKNFHEKSRETYGARRIRQDLVEDDELISRTRVGRLMKQQGLESKVKRKFKATTNSNHGRPVAPNLLDRDFSATAPNQKWAGDITYIWTSEGWLYLAVILDLYSRRVIGWAVSSRMKRDLAIRALDMAVALRQPPKGCIHHTDRGSQYCSHDYQKRLRKYDFKVSMSGKGNCYDCDYVVAA